MLEEFYPGDIVILDPDAPHQPGDFVVAKLERDDKVIFRKHRPRGFDGRGSLIVEVGGARGFPIWSNLSLSPTLLVVTGTATPSSVASSMSRMRRLL
jgi:hypothetical protein